MKLFPFTSCNTPRRKFLLPLLLATGALLHAQPIAYAQSGGATQPLSAAGVVSQLFSGVGAIAMLALIIGYFRPQLFAFLFKAKTTKGRVCGTFGAAMLVCAMIGSSLEPKPVETAGERAAKSAQAKAEDAARVAKQDAKAAEARTQKGEKDAAAANAKSSGQSASAKNTMGKNGKRVAAAASKGDADSPGQPDTSPAAAPVDDGLPDNVTVMDIPNVGKRQVGVVDEVAYTIVSAETAKTLGVEAYHRDADGMFFVLHEAANNTDKETHDANTTLMKLQDDQGREFDPSTEGSAAQSAAGDQNAQPFMAQLQPGVVKKFTLVFDAPEDAKGLRLKIPAGFGSGKSAAIKVPTAGE